MSAIGGILYLMATMIVGRVMYGKWRASILDRAKGKTGIYSSLLGAEFDVPPRLVWAAGLSFLISLVALPVVGMIMLTMWRPPKSDWEKREEIAELRMERIRLDQELAQSRRDLAASKEAHDGQ